MFAVFKTGGKQYKVKEGDIISVEKLPLEEGAKVEFSEILVLENNNSVKVGTPTISGASITATLLKQKKQATIYVFKKSRRKNYRRKNGHRQVVSILKIESIKG